MVWLPGAGRAGKVYYPSVLRVLSAGYVEFGGLLLHYCTVAGALRVAPTCHPEAEQGHSAAKDLLIICHPEAEQDRSVTRVLRSRGISPRPAPMRRHHHLLSGY